MKITLFQRKNGVKRSRQSRAAFSSVCDIHLNRKITSFKYFVRVKRRFIVLFFHIQYKSYTIWRNMWISTLHSIMCMRHVLKMALLHFPNGNIVTLLYILMCYITLKKNIKSIIYNLYDDKQLRFIFCCKETKKLSWRKSNQFNSK